MVPRQLLSKGYCQPYAMALSGDRNGMSASIEVQSAACGDYRHLRFGCAYIRKSGYRVRTMFNSQTSPRILIALAALTFIGLDVPSALARGGGHGGGARAGRGNMGSAQSKSSGSNFNSVNGGGPQMSTGKAPGSNFNSVNGGGPQMSTGSNPIGKADAARAKGLGRNGRGGYGGYGYGGGAVGGSGGGGWGNGPEWGATGTAGSASMAKRPPQKSGAGSSGVEVENYNWPKTGDASSTPAAGHGTPASK
jgi:hypothetical protein